MAVNAASAANAYSQAQATGNSQTYYLISNPTLSKRFKASSNRAEFSYVLTNATDSSGKKGPGLVKLNKATGALEMQVVLGDKTPEYELDSYEGRLLFMKSEKEIVGYKF